MAIQNCRLPVMFGSHRAILRAHVVDCEMMAYLLVDMRISLH